MSSLQTRLAAFSSTTRLYALQCHESDADLIVEGFAAIETLHEIGVRDVIVLSVDAETVTDRLLGQGATLMISLADGTRSGFSGVIQEIDDYGSDGALSRYRLRVVSWLWLLSQTRTSRVWQDCTIVEIVESIFNEFPAYASWQWGTGVARFLADARARPFVAMHRESYFDFFVRLLAEEGIGFRVEEWAAAPPAHRVVFFADSVHDFDEDATSASTLGGEGIRYHAGRATEVQDSVLALACQRVLRPASVTVVGYDHLSAQAVVGSATVGFDALSPQAPRIESCDYVGADAYAGIADAQRYAQLHLDASQACGETWYARSSVRTLRPGTRFRLTQGPLQARADQPAAAYDYAVLRVTSVGLNNLPGAGAHASSTAFEPLPQLLQSCLQDLARRPFAYAPPQAQAQQDHAYDREGGDEGSAHTALIDSSSNAHAPMLATAIALGYANSIEAIRADVPWRPVLSDGTGLLHRPGPTAPGSQTAIVIGRDGRSSAADGDEICCDALGRIRIRFHGQGVHDDAQASCWVRVVQRSAHAGMGMQFLPRIGQEVLVKFLGNDIEHPVVMGALYNGQGEGGIPPTPAGLVDRESDTGVFTVANDQRIGGQGNLVAGNSPTWHGASAGAPGHGNASAKWGIRSKEFGGLGYNQLMFDDTDAQGQVQLKSTSFATELSIGHLLHHADNYRGSFRGTGIELRTDAYGAIRAARGIILSSYALAHSAAQRDPAGDNIAALAMLKQASTLTQRFNDVATLHKTVGYGVHRGPAKANASALDPAASPMQAMATAAAGMVAADSLEKAMTDAQAKHTGTEEGKLPHTTDPLIIIAARAGMAATAGQDLQLVNGETTTLISGQDSQFVAGNQTRIQTGQAIGVLGGAVQPGEQQTGLQLIAAQGAVALQAQAGPISVQAKDLVSIMSGNAHIDWAGAKSITLATAGGARITIEGGNITVACPGKLTVHAGEKRFEDATTLTREAPAFAKTPFHRRFLLRWGGEGAPVKNRRFRLHTEDGGIVSGKTDQDGYTQPVDCAQFQHLSVEILPDEND